MPHMLAQEHMGIVDALRYGTARNEATINATLTAIGSNLATLALTFTGDGIWVIGANTTIPTNVTLWIPPGVKVSRSSGITLTVNGPLISWSPNWETGPGATVRGLSQGIETNRLNGRQLLITSDSADAIVVRGAIATGAAVRVFVEQGGGNAGISISRTDASNASTWQFLVGAGGSLATSRPGAGAMTLLTDTGLGIGLGMVPNALLQLLSDSAFKPSTNTWSITPSNRAVKDLEGPYEEGLAYLRALPKAQYYRYNGKAQSPTDGHQAVGFVAEELLPVAPELVESYAGKLEESDAAPTTIYGVQLGRLWYTYLNAFLEIDQRLTALEQGEADEARPVHRARRRGESGD
jgi:hypothetical protein